MPRKVEIVVCPQCEKQYLRAEIEEDGRCRWCALCAQMEAWMDWRENRKRKEQS